MRLEFATKAAAQAFADKTHTAMIGSDPTYAASVASSQTTAWAKPYQDLDANENPISTKWFVNVKDRAKVVLSTAEKSVLKPFSGESKIRASAP